MAMMLVSATEEGVISGDITNVTVEPLFVNPERIVNGIEVNPPRKYPFMIAFFPFGCGGSLVAPNVMLTAAHCAGFATSVQIGRHDLYDYYESYESHYVLEEVRHPKYNEDTIDYDLCWFERGVTAEPHQHKVVIQIGKYIIIGMRNILQYV